MFSKIPKFTLLTITAMGFAACESVTDADKTTETSTDTTVVSYFELSNLDTTVSPCEDFYKYAVGGWLKNNPIPSTESRWGSFNVLRDSNEIKLKSILLEFSENNSAEKASMEQQLGDFYISAMDSVTANKKGIQPLQEKMDLIDGIKNKQEFVQLSAELAKIGVGNMFGVYVGQDDKNSNAYITHVYQSGLGMPDKGYYLKEDAKSEELRNAYVEHVEKMFALAGKSREEASEIAEDIMKMETQLAKVSMDKVDQRDPNKTYNKYKIEELKKVSPNLLWDEYFSTLGISPDELVVGQPKFIESVNNYLNNFSLDELKTYMKWNLLNSYAHYLDSGFVDQNFDFYSRTLSGTKEMKSRWKRSLNMVNANLGELMGKAFVKRHFSENAKEEVRDMVENLRAVFKERIQQLEWMGDSTKEKAIQKLNAFNMKIGYPDKWKDYSSVEITDSNLVQNVMNARKFNYEYMMNKLGKPVDEDEWFMTPQTVNAYYSSSQNEIVFPAGILQPPFYSENADPALNYGSIGAVIGHEFTHGFDDQGSKYDHEGNLKNWWTEDDRSLFDQRAEFVVEQFNKYEPLDSTFLNGKLTLGENIADLGGVTLAYYALLKEVGNNAPEKIDGFDHKQRFFLGWAQVWHMNITEEEMRKRVVTDPHSPGEYRVNGPLSNLPEFADAFGCTTGDKMVSKDSLRAVIW